MVIYVFRTCDKYKSPASMRDYCVTTSISKLVEAIRYAIEDGAVDYYYTDDGALPDGEEVGMMWDKLDETLGKGIPFANKIPRINDEMCGGFIVAYKDGEILQ